MVMTTTLAEYHSIDLWLLHYESFPLADWEQEFGSEKVHSHLTLSYAGWIFVDCSFRHHSGLIGLFPLAFKVD